MTIVKLSLPFCLSVRARIYKAKLNHAVLFMSAITSPKEFEQCIKSCDSAYKHAIEVTKPLPDALKAEYDKIHTQCLTECVDAIQASPLRPERR